jgi:tetratricopeptide (TPR) repeat protein
MTRLPTAAAVLILGILTLCLPAAAAEPGLDPPSLDRGYHLLYSLHFPEAQQEFERWQQQHPQDPMGPVSEAAGLLFSEFNRLGVLESQFYVKDSSFDKRPKLQPDPETKTRFDADLVRAEGLSRTLLAQDPNHKDALFVMALCSGLRADYAAMVEKHNLASLGYIKQGQQYADKLIALDPAYYDAYLALGMSKYIIGSQAAPVRWLLRLGGYGGDKQEGIHDLQLTAAHGHYLAPFARLLLAIAYLRDKDKSGARALLAGLQRDFPDNPLFGKEISRLDSSYP